MKKLLFTAALFAISTGAMAENGLYVGVGALSASSDYCSDCDSSGWFIEAGQKMNRFVTTQAKFGRGDLDRDGDFSMAYFGANLSPDVGPDWLETYGKLGAMWTKVNTDIFIGLSREGDPQYDSSHNDFKAAFGLGVRLMPMGGWYGQLEALRSELEGEKVMSTTLSFGLLF